MEIKSMEVNEVRQKTLKRDKERLLAWAKSIRETMVPPLADGKMQGIAAFALGDIYRVADEVEKQLGKM